MTPLRQRMLEDMTLRNFSPRTKESYVRQVARFAKHFGRPPDELGPEEIRQFQLHLVQEGKVSWGLFNVIVCALRFFYKVTLDRPFLIERIPYAKRPKRRPVALAKNEVRRLLLATSGVNARAILSTIYATGLRAAEITELRTNDIDTERGLIRVRSGKGDKDRSRRKKGRYQQGRLASHPASQLRHAPSRERDRRPDDPGAARSSLGLDDGPLHPRLERLARQDQEPLRSARRVGLRWIARASSWRTSSAGISTPIA